MNGVKAMTTCRHCGNPIHFRRSWPSGVGRWYENVGYPLGEWAFCEAVDGNPHEPDIDTEWAELNK